MHAIGDINSLSSGQIIDKQRNETIVFLKSGNDANFFLKRLLVSVQHKQIRFCSDFKKFKDRFFKVCYFFPQLLHVRMPTF